MVRRDILMVRLPSRGTGHISPETLCSVRPPRRILKWVLRALEVETHGIRSNSLDPRLWDRGQDFSSRPMCFCLTKVRPEMRTDASPGRLRQAQITPPWVTRSAVVLLEYSLLFELYAFDSKSFMLLIAELYALLRA